MAISNQIFNGVDLSRLPAPRIIAPIDFRAIRDAAIADLIALHQSATGETLTISAADPLYKLVELFVYREMLIRASVQEDGLAVMLAFARGADLDHIAVRYGLERFIFDPGNIVEGVEPTLESDEDFRLRIVDVPETYSVAGPAGAYVELAKSAHPDVAFASVCSPAPCDIVVSVQSRIGDGTASPPLLAAVEAVLSDENRRPLGDRVTVQSAAIIAFAIEASIRTYPGVGAEIAIAAGRARLEGWLAENLRLGRDITTDGIIAALRVEGVQKLTLISPVADIVCDVTQAGHCTGIIITHAGTGE